MTPVKTLLGQRECASAIICLQSLLRFSNDPLELQIYSDGTLTKDSIETLLSALPGSRVVERDAREETLATKLKNYPRCLEFRSKNVLAQKLFDVALYEPQVTLFYCDADVLFVRPFSGLFDAHKDNKMPVFMKDRGSAYALSAWQLLGPRRLSLPAAINTGIICFPVRAFRLDVLERFLADDSLRIRFEQTPCWAEQTLWALLAAEEDCRVIDERQAKIISPRLKGEDLSELLAVHFVRSYRSLLRSFPVPVSENSAVAATIRVSSAARLQPQQLIFAALRRKVSGLHIGK